MATATAAASQQVSSQSAPFRNVRAGVIELAGLAEQSQDSMPLTRGMVEEAQVRHVSGADEDAPELFWDPLGRWLLRQALVHDLHIDPDKIARAEQHVDTNVRKISEIRGRNIALYGQHMAVPDERGGGHELEFIIAPVEFIGTFEN